MPPPNILYRSKSDDVRRALTRLQVQIIQRDENGRITAQWPSDDPRGMGVAGLLTSEVYGLRSELDLETLRLLDEKRALAAKETLTEEERARLRQLDEQLRGLDFTKTVRDPMYKPLTIRHT